MPAVKLSPLFNDQAITFAGAPASGYKVYSYAAGSSTPLATYTDSTGNTPQNPVTLNASGFPTNGQIWLQSGLAYKLVLTDANDVVIKTEDNITGINDTTSTANQFQASGVIPTYVSSTSFTLPGDQTSEFHANRRLQFTVTAGTSYGRIQTAVFTTLTTVTVAMESGALDSGLSAVNLSILRADHSALPEEVTPAQFDNSTKRATTAFIKAAGVQFAGESVLTATTVLTAASHTGKLLVLNNTGAATYTLPAANSCPPGTVIVIENVNTGASTVQRAGADSIGMPTAVASVTLGQGDTLFLETDNVSTWRAFGGSAQLKYAAAMTALGINQTFTDVTLSRTNGVVYTNSTGRPIVVYAYGVTSAPNGFIQAIISGVTLVSATQPVNGSGVGITAVIPAGSTYRIDFSSVTVNAWLELR